jgi:hypothetical protein
MKRISLLLVQVAAFLVLTGCVVGDPGDIKPWSHTSTKLDYTITFPAEWGWFEETEYEFYAISPEKDGASFRVRGYSVAGRSSDLRSLDQLVAAEVQRQYEQFGNESAVFPQEMRGNRAVIPAISLFQSEGISYTRKTLYFEKGDYFGWIDFIGPNATFDEDEEFLGVEASLTFF